MTNRERILLFVIGLALGAFAVNAFAAQGGEGSNTGCTGQGNPNSPCQPGGPNVPPPHQPPVYPPELPPIVVVTPPPSPVSQEVVNNPINSNANVGINENTNNNSATGVGVGNASSSAQGGNATASGGNSNATGGAGGSATLNANLSVGASSGASARSENSANNSGNANNTVIVEGDAAQKRNPVATAVAPTMITGNDQCLVPFGLGVQAVGVGVAAGGALRDENCEAIKLSRELSRLGHDDAALKLLRADPRVEAALKAVGK